MTNSLLFFIFSLVSIPGWQSQGRVVFGKPNESWKHMSSLRKDGAIDADLRR